MNARFAPIVPACVDPRQPENALSPLLANMAAFDEALSKMALQGGSRLQDFDDRTQRAIKAADIEEAVGIEFERLEDALSERPLTPVEKVQHDLLERILVTACQSVEARS
jgi:hypothetical protein